MKKSEIEALLTPIMENLRILNKEQGKAVVDYLIDNFELPDTKQVLTFEEFCKWQNFDYEHVKMIMDGHSEYVHNLYRGYLLNTPTDTKEVKMPTEKSINKAILSELESILERCKGVHSEYHLEIIIALTQQSK